MISKDKVLYLAHISRLHVADQEIPALAKQIQDVLVYAARVKEAGQRALSQENVSLKNVNVFKQDMVISTDGAAILAQAPESIENYFVVPVIIDQK